jgi:hypothetical protein
MTNKINRTAAFIAKARANAAPADLLKAGGRAAALAGEQVKNANEERGTALDMLIAGMTWTMLHTDIAFDICDRAGNVVESTTATLAAYAKGFYNADGSDNRTKTTAFRSTVLPSMFGVAGDQSAGAKAAWALVTGKALPTAICLQLAGVDAKMNDEGKLVLDGGEGETADKLKAAAGKSTSALVKAAKGEEGSNREAPQNEKSEGNSATPSELTRATVALAKLIASGKATACAATLSNLRAIAALVASNPDAFADD